MGTLIIVQFYRNVFRINPNCSCPKCSGRTDVHVSVRRLLPTAFRLATSSHLLTSVFDKKSLSDPTQEQPHSGCIVRPGVLVHFYFRTIFCKRNWLSNHDFGLNYLFKYVKEMGVNKYCPIISGLVGKILFPFAEWTNSWADNSYGPISLHINMAGNSLYISVIYLPM